MVEDFVCYIILGSVSWHKTWLSVLIIFLLIVPDFSMPWVSFESLSCMCFCDPLFRWCIYVLVIQSFSERDLIKYQTMHDLFKLPYNAPLRPLFERLKQIEMNIAFSEIKIVNTIYSTSFFFYMISSINCVHAAAPLEGFLLNESAPVFYQWPLLNH